ncbi:response regulator [Planktothrix mougeotii]|uniref:Response regulator n=1 Tax=Planktothrix mougeotii LEGE 06226 TaxID=1828728 RepID=A0ABR9UEP4_9CYAN|nr:response regulator [Planktothrix mougeotii]MBE9144301.1 response regulator [Planktothrix mougeotii LEGE 06226]
MTFEEAVRFVDSTLESKIGKKLTLTEKNILKAAWNNETYSNVAETLYLSIGHIKDLASRLWQRLSDTFREKITKNNFRRLIEELYVTQTFPEEKIVENDTDESLTSKGNILIIGDLIPNLQLLTEVLSKRGYKVCSVPNGKMGLTTIHKHLPDVILLNIKMPEMDGYEICQILKADEVTSEIPVIFLSGLDEIIDKAKAFQVGGVDLITQPFQPEEVIGRIQTQLTIQQQKKQLKEQIKQHQQTVEILYKSRALLANLFNSSHDGIAAIQTVRDLMTEEINDFRCLVVNPVLAKLLGQKREALMGKTSLKKLLNQLIPTLFDSLISVVETGEMIEQTFYWENHDEQNWYYLTAIKFGDGCSITIRNITNLKILEFKRQIGIYLE